MQLYLKTGSGQAHPIPSGAWQEVQGGVRKLALLGLRDGTSSWSYRFRGDQVTIRSSEWVLVQCDQNPYRKGVTGHRHTRRLPREDEGRDQGDAPTSP